MISLPKANITFANDKGDLMVATASIQYSKYQGNRREPFETMILYVEDGHQFNNGLDTANTWDNLEIACTLGSQLKLFVKGYPYLIKLNQIISIPVQPCVMALHVEILVTKVDLGFIGNIKNFFSQMFH